jgi:4-carboxymuconolactone decarboxylase
MATGRIETIRFPLIPEEEWTPEQRHVARDIVSGPRGELRGPFVPLIYSPGLAAPVQKVGEHLRFGTRLPNDLLEIAVLITARHSRCANIWHSHRALALKAGLGRDIIAAIAAGQRPALLPEMQAEIYDFCVELTQNHSVSDATFDRLAVRWDRATVIDVIGICGYYAMLAMVLNAANIPLPDGAVPFES